MIKPVFFGLCGLVLCAAACSQAGTHGAVPDSSPGTSTQPPGGGGGTSEDGHRNAGGASLMGTLDGSDRVHVEDEVDTFAAMVGGSTRISYVVRLVPGYTNLYEFRLGNTGSGWAEKFLLQPPTNVTGPAPLLVVFH